MNRFLQALANLFRIEELRKRVLFTLALLAVYRIGAHIPTPGINGAVLDQIFSAAQGTALGIFDLFSGGNFRRLTIFALGIMPYITSSIILQLMTVVFPYLERLQKEGELGRRKITQYTRYLTIALAIIQSFSTAQLLQTSPGAGGQALVYHPGWGFTLMTVLTLTTGSAFIMWLGEQISDAASETACRSSSSWGSWWACRARFLTCGKRSRLAPGAEQCSRPSSPSYCWH